MIDLVKDEELIDLPKDWKIGDCVKDFLVSSNIEKFSDHDEALKGLQNISVFDCDLFEYLAELFPQHKFIKTELSYNMLIDLEHPILLVLTSNKELGFYVINNMKTDPSESITKIVNKTLHWIWIKINSF